MPKPQASDISGVDMKWHVLRMLLPYLLQHRARVSLAFAALALAKVATISLPSDRSMPIAPGAPPSGRLTVNVPSAS